jgi:hypothetical protein
MAMKPEFPAESWRKSAYCVGESHCVEVATDEPAVGLRNSRHPEITLTFDTAEWRIFLDDLKSGALPLDRHLEA